MISHLEGPKLRSASLRGKTHRLTVRCTTGISKGLRHARPTHSMEKAKMPLYRIHSALGKLSGVGTRSYRAHPAQHSTQGNKQTRAFCCICCRTRFGFVRPVPLDVEARGEAGGDLSELLSGIVDALLGSLKFMNGCFMSLEGNESPKLQRDAATKCSSGRRLHPPRRP
jgi:hypothetical protein